MSNYDFGSNVTNLWIEWADHPQSLITGSWNGLKSFYKNFYQDEVRYFHASPAQRGKIDADGFKEDITSFGASGPLIDVGGRFINGVKSVRPLEETPYTRSNLKLGQEIHEKYHAGEFGKEFRLPSGKRIDFLDIENETIYELKPNNPRAIKQGFKQLNIYKMELQAMPQFKGINWKTVLEKY